MKHKIIPAPKTQAYGDDVFAFAPTYYCDGFDGDERAAIAAASDYFDRVFARFLTRANSRDEAGIVCICDPALDEHAYTVDAADGCVTIHVPSCRSRPDSSILHL